MFELHEARHELNQTTVLERNDRKSLQTTAFCSIPMLNFPAYFSESSNRPFQRGLGRRNIFLEDGRDRERGNPLRMQQLWRDCAVGICVYKCREYLQKQS